MAINPPPWAEYGHSGEEGVPKTVLLKASETVLSGVHAKGGFHRSLPRFPAVSVADLCGLVLSPGRGDIMVPALIQRMKTGAALNTPDMNTVYTPDAKGHTDYLTLME